MCGNGASTSRGDLVKTVDAVGNCVMGYYDALHRVTDVGDVQNCHRFRYDNTNGVLGTIPTGVSVSNKLGNLVEAETDTCASPITQSSIITDEWFGYTARGENSDAYESTPHSGGYYHSSATYWPNGVPSQLNGPNGYTAGWNVDGEGRVYSNYNTGGNPLSSTTYNAASQPTQVNFASSDSDSFTYDPNTGRMTQYKFNVNGSSLTAALGWNANGTLRAQNITDAFNSADTQNCSYGYDDIARITSANCGSAAAQTFAFDAFGNISKSGSPYSFQPTYSTATNRMTAIGSFTPTYDNNGDVTNDSLHSYTWNADGRPLTTDSVNLTYDALDRMVEQNRSGTYTQFAYSPTGFKMQIMNGQVTQKAFVPLPAGAMAVFTSTGYTYIHADWLGSPRLGSTPSRTIYFDVAYAPFGETYVSSGSTDPAFTGQRQDTVSGLYDFSAREYSIQGRWSSPDPAGIAAVDPTNPQSWNRYAYVTNDPIDYLDPMGLHPMQYECSNMDPLGLGCNVANGGGGGSCSNISAPSFSPWAGGAICSVSSSSFGFWSGGCWDLSEDDTCVGGTGLGGSGLGGGTGGGGGGGVQARGANACILSIFNPSCKRPACISVMLDTASETDVVPPLPAGVGLDDAAKATASTIAITHIVQNGLAVPLRSSIVRGILAWGETAATAAFAIPLAIQSVVGLRAEYKARDNRTCRTAWESN